MGNFGAIFGISWFWFFSATVLSLYPGYGKSLLHVRQSVITLFLVSFAVGFALAPVVYFWLLKEVRRGTLCLVSSLAMSSFLLYLFFIRRPTFAHSFIALGIREFIHDTDGLYIILDLGLLAFFSGLFVIPLYRALLNPESVSKSVAGISKSDEDFNVPKPEGVKVSKPDEGARSFKPDEGVSKTVVVENPSKIEVVENLSRTIVAVNNLTNVICIVLSAPFIYYLQTKKINIFNIFLILAVSNATVGLYFKRWFQNERA